EVVLLFDPVQRERRMQRTRAVDEVLLLLERLAPFAVPALVRALVDVAGLVDPPRDLGHAGLVARFGRADEVVERDIQLAPGARELLFHLVAVRQRRQPLLDRGAIHVLRVLVVPHQEPRVVARQPVVARDDVGGDLFISRAQVRPAVHVVDRRREEVTAQGWYAFTASAWTSFTERLFAAARRAQSSNSGTALTIRPSRRAILKRTAPIGVSTDTISRWRHSRSTSSWRNPIVVVSRKMMSASVDRRSGGAITVSSVPGRFFFI